MTKLGDRENFYVLFGMFAVSCAGLITSLSGLAPDITTFALLTVFFGVYDYYFYRRIPPPEKEIENNADKTK